MITLKVGSRSSNLAQLQVKEVFGLLSRPDVTYVHKEYSTLGDIDKTTSLTTNPADNFFTDALDKALLHHVIDVAVHSAKDLPKKLPKGLSIVALTKSIGDADAWVSHVHWSDLPQHAKVGTSSLLRQKQIKALRPDVQIVDIRGTIQERLSLVEQKKIDGLVVAACAMHRLGLSKLIRDVFPWEGMPLQGQLAVVARSEDVYLEELFAPIDVRQSYGQVTLVGAGPGDPGLMTLKGLEAIKKADCIVYDYLVDASLLKYAPLAEHIFAGKRKGQHNITQEALSRLLKEKAFEGKRVVRLKGGDPLIFGRGADEITYLKDYHIPVTIIPGVSSATGIASLLHMPLTARGIAQSVSFNSAHEEDEDLKGVQPVKVPNTDTIVYLMGLTKLKEIVEALKKNGKADDFPIMIVSNGTRITQKVVKGTLGNILKQVEEHPLLPPALIIVGRVVDFYQESERPTWLFCGTRPESYTALGRIVPWQMIDLSVKTLSDEDKLKFVADFDAADIVLLTSPSAVKFFMQQIIAYKKPDDFRPKIVAAIGKHTARDLDAYGVHADVISQVETAEGLFDAITRLMDVRGKRFFFPRSILPNPFLRDALMQKGAIINEWAVYTNVKPTCHPLPAEKFTGIIFTSPSTVVHFLECYNSIPKEWQILVKGPVTMKALTMAGYKGKVIV